MIPHQTVLVWVVWSQQPQWLQGYGTDTVQLVSNSSNSEIETWAHNLDQPIINDIIITS